MAKKAKKLNTDLDDSVKRGMSDDEFAEDEMNEDEGFTMVDEEEPSEDDVMYTMGEIVVDDSSVVNEVNEDQQILQTGVKKSSNDDDEEEEDDKDDTVWIDNDALEDDDPFLEQEDFDPDEVYD